MQSDARFRAILYDIAADLLVHVVIDNGDLRSRFGEAVGRESLARVVDDVLRMFNTE